MAEESSNTRHIKIDWQASDVISRYATNLVVQRLEHEYVLSFFEVHPPLIIGQIPEDMESIPADCVARVIIAAGKMAEFVAVLQEQLQRTIVTSPEDEQ